MYVVCPSVIVGHDSVCVKGVGMIEVGGNYATGALQVCVMV